ncbi:hypothetical protein NFI96_006673, partial [Prochilodus magdalenae]
MGCKAYGLLRSLVALDKPGDKTYVDIKTVLQQHFSPKPLVIAERFCFHKRNQEAGETVSQYVAVLKRLSEHSPANRGNADVQESGGNRGLDGDGGVTVTAAQRIAE